MLSDLINRYGAILDEHLSVYMRIESGPSLELRGFANKKRLSVWFCLYFPLTMLSVLALWLFGFWGVLMIPFFALACAFVYFELLAKPEIALFDLGLSDKARSRLQEAIEENAVLTEKLEEQTKRSEKVGAESLQWMQKSSAEQEKVKRLRQDVRDLNKKLEAAEYLALEEIPLERLIQHFTAQIERADTLDVDTTHVAAMYAMMNSKIPDIQRVRELSAVPNEIFRASQKQAIIEHYSKVITKAENDEAISDEERIDKVNSYRLAREQELREEEHS